MSEERIERGEFCWVDLLAHKLEPACAFYQELFGWDCVDRESRSGPVYRYFQQDGVILAGVSQMPNLVKLRGLPPIWNVYVKVAQLKPACQQAKELDGKAVLPPTRVGDAGSMAIVRDPSGGHLCLWEANRHHGFGRHVGVGASCWNMLATRDLAAAAGFYGALLSWEFDETTELGAPYRVIRQHGTPRGGMLEMNDAWEAEIPAHWSTFFAVESLGAMIDQVLALGGTVRLEPAAVSRGQVALVADPQGAVFGLMQVGDDS